MTLQVSIKVKIICKSLFIISENYIGAPKIVLLQSISPYSDSNIGLFSITVCKFIDLNSLFFIQSKETGNQCTKEIQKSKETKSDNFCYSKAIRLLPLNPSLLNLFASFIVKKLWTKVRNRYKKWSKEIKSDNFCYSKAIPLLPLNPSLLIHFSPFIVKKLWTNPRSQYKKWSKEIKIDNFSIVKRYHWSLWIHRSIIFYS